MLPVSSIPHRDCDSVSLRRQLWPDWEEGHEPRASLWNLWERVRQEFPENFMGIDRFPSTVQDNERYAQLEVSYAPGHSNPAYDALERRFLEVLELLWAYGPALAETQRPYEDSLEGLAPPLRETVEQLLRRPEREPLPLSPVDDLREFRSLAVLGLRGIVPSVFVFPERRLVLWQNGVSFSQVHLGDLAYKPMLQTLCMTSGLYLRG